ncbi:uncharacterized protein KY384_001973 [Bacidia gigantensis]|uniref:uncharacterized protein n=1 Tax=Bacidia gigantensis TaxID=2732470 RepID=UPI001D0482A4|nr:uncharacterized protein KY384_001973 [Bacidia gigantensis]KAG8533190.1 hypothetical protein KY384_001973 [Bacidia gigantensis]
MAQTSADMDDRPVAVRRKRRSSTALTDAPQELKLEPDEDCILISPEEAKTPSRRQKRVRFSHPGADAAGPSSSTGLTPSMNRTSFAAFRPQPKSRSRVPPRLSLPNPGEMSLVSPSLASAPSTGEVLIMPWCDKMDERAKRRLRRNHLSEVQNEYDAGQKPSPKTKAEYEKELQHVKAQISFLNKNQMHGEADGERTASKELKRARELEEEVVRLKQEIQDRGLTEAHQLADVPAYQPLTPSPTIVLDDITDDFEDTTDGRQEPLIDQASPTTPRYAEASTQASIRDPQQDDMLRTARLEFEHTCPGENALGLIPETSKQLIDAMLKQAGVSETRRIVAEAELGRETTTRSNVQKNLNLALEQQERTRRHNRKVCDERDALKARVNAAHERVAELEVNVEASWTREQMLEKSDSEKERSIQKLGNAMNKERTEARKLENLIEQMDEDHKAEVSKLHSDWDEAVADLEDKVAAESESRDEAEAKVERRNIKIRELQARLKELIKAVNEQQLKIRNLEDALETERIGRERAETISEEERIGREEERIGREEERIGREEERIGREHAEHNVLKSEHNARNSDKRYEQADLMLQEERDAGRRAVQEECDASKRASAADRAEISHLLKKLEALQDARISDSEKRNANVLERQGLLTPIVGSRFRDVDEIDGMGDSVEVRRGKKAKTRKRPDSGIVILEEDEDEVMGDY